MSQGVKIGLVKGIEGISENVGGQVKNLKAKLRSRSLKGQDVPIGAGNKITVSVGLIRVIRAAGWGPLRIKG